VSHAASIFVALLNTFISLSLSINTPSALPEWETAGAADTPRRFVRPPLDGATRLANGGEGSDRRAAKIYTRFS